MSDRHEGQSIQGRDSYEPRFSSGTHSPESSSLPGENPPLSPPGQSSRPEHGISDPPLAHELGSALTIDEVAELLGCSPWTVRQRYLRQGLPHLQARARAKLFFFREQIIAWVEKRQRQKGGLLR